MENGHRTNSYIATLEYDTAHAVSRKMKMEEELIKFKEDTNEEIVKKDRIIANLKHKLELKIKDVERVSGFYTKTCAQYQDLKTKTQEEIKALQVELGKVYTNIQY